jgi:hypothetical protein
MQWFWNHYTTDENQRVETTASPLRASIDDLAGLPKALVITGEADVLRDEGEPYSRKLHAAGVDVTATRLGGITHDFVMLDALRSNNAAGAATAQATQYSDGHLGLATPRGRRAPRDSPPLCSTTTPHSPVSPRPRGLNSDEGATHEPSSTHPTTRERAQHSPAADLQLARSRSLGKRVDRREKPFDRRSPAAPKAASVCSPAGVGSPTRAPPRRCAGGGLRPRPTCCSTTCRRGQLHLAAMSYRSLGLSRSVAYHNMGPSPEVDCRWAALK